MSESLPEKKTKKRIFCCGEGISFRYVMAENKASAAAYFGEEARVPDSDDIRKIWLDNELHKKTPEDVQKLFGITRQALSLWRQKAGADLPTHSDHLSQQAMDLARAVFDPEKSASQMAAEANVPVRFIKAVAAEKGVKLKTLREKKPADEEIVRLSKGRTWHQLAEACNVKLHTLQHYVYGKPELAKQLRENLVFEASGADAHGRMHDVDKLVSLYRQGKSAYRIAEEFRVQPMTVVYWLKKLGIYEGARHQSG